MGQTRLATLILIGTLGGFFSGLFGVGGGIVMVPLLVLWAKIDERSATSASLGAIIIIGAAGAATQAGYGRLHLAEGLLVGIPAIGGVLAGTALQQRIPSQRVSLLFAGMMVAVAIMMIIGEGDESTVAVSLELGRVMIALLVGFAAGVISGLLGVGGGTLFVPGLSFLLGLHHVDAAATSLLAIVPVAMVGSLRQHHYGNLNIKAAATLGLVAVPSAAVGVVVLNAIPARIAEVAFAALALLVAAQLARKGLAKPAA